MTHPALFPSARREKTGDWLKDHSLSLFLAGLLVLQSIAYWFSELPDWRETQRALGLAANIWPSYTLHFVAEYLVSIVADTYGAVLLVLASKWFFEKGSSESEAQPAPNREHQEGEAG